MCARSVQDHDVPYSGAHLTSMRARRTHIHTRRTHLCIAGTLRHTAKINRSERRCFSRTPKNELRPLQRIHGRKGVCPFERTPHHAGSINERIMILRDGTNATNPRCNHVEHVGVHRLVHRFIHTRAIGESCGSNLDRTDSSRTTRSPARARTNDAPSKTDPSRATSPSAPGGRPTPQTARSRPHAPACGPLEPTRPPGAAMTPIEALRGSQRPTPELNKRPTNRTSGPQSRSKPQNRSLRRASSCLTTQLLTRTDEEAKTLARQQPNPRLVRLRGGTSTKN